MIRLILSPTRSGSTALLRCFENHPLVDRVYHQPVKSGHRSGADFDYTYFELLDQSSQQVLVAKETIGGFDHDEANFSPLPATHGAMLRLGAWSLSRSIVERLDPVVLIRDPRQTWNSIEKLNRWSAGKSPFHSPFSFFLDSYRHVAQFALDAHHQGLNPMIVTLEDLGYLPDVLLSEICQRWGLPYDDAMVRWTLPYGAKTWFSDETRVRMASDPRFRKSKETLEHATSFAYQPSAVEISPLEASTIKRELEPLYETLASLAHREILASRAPSQQAV